MLYYLVTGLMLLHTVFWGLGLSWLVLPRRWRTVWWIFAPVLGLALQSAVVWFGAQTSLPGTARYGWISEGLPVLLLVFAVRRAGLKPAWRRLAALPRNWPVLLVLVAVGGMLLWPMTKRGAWTLSSSSLGSCDHADYAAGARVFLEFSPGDREGFMGLTEVTRVGSAETFFEFWQKLNHFTPSALLAHHAALLELRPYQLVSVSGVAVLLLTVPLVLLLARLVGLGSGARLAVAAVYGFSPLSAYAVHQGALGQLYAAHGIAVLTLGVIAFSQRRGEAWRHGAVLFAAIWLLAGSYNFILSVALAPAVAWMFAQSWLEKSWRHWPSVAGLAALSFLATVGLFWGRYVGVVERFQLFEKFDFGWPVPRQWPASWLGAAADVELHAWPGAWGWIASVVVVVAFGVGLAIVGRRTARHGLAALALVAPVVAGWAILTWESHSRANAAYDAFKILSVFLPGLLAGMCVWAGLSRMMVNPFWRWSARIGLALLIVVNVWGAFRFIEAMRQPPLRVERVLSDLRRLESMPRIRSLNMRIEDFWSRLWANCFLLRKEQYFLTHTYEGRLNTPLKGEWDLSDSLLQAIPRRPADYLRVNEMFHVVRVGAPGFMRLEFGEGWHAQEGRYGNRWRWSRGTAEIVFENPSSRPVEGRLRLKLRGIVENPLHVSLAGTELETKPVARTLRDYEWTEVVVPPGRSVLQLRLGGPLGTVEGDLRPLGISLTQLSFVAAPPAR